MQKGPLKVLDGGHGSATQTGVDDRRASADGQVVVTRFAPSPSGHLHVGGARTALFCWAYARGRGGKFILRIEDTDQKRSSDAASIAFLQDLAWLGVDWDEGPVFDQSGGGDHGPYFQAQRLEIYQRYLDQLLRSGRAYYAFDTAEELESHRRDAKARNIPYRYDGSAARSLSSSEVESRLKAGMPAVIRFAAPQGEVVIRDAVLGDATLPPGEIDDFVIRKADGFPTYHFAVVVDDELMGVTHVLRAQEHFNNTARHMLLQDALGFRRPVYGHLPLIFNPDGSKMSKRDKDKVLRKAVQERGLRELPAVPPGPEAAAISAAMPSQEQFTKWLADKTVQLPVGQSTALATALGVNLPEINVDDFRRSGYLPGVLCNFLALNGWSPGNDLEKFDLEFLIGHFDLDRVLKTPAKFDRAKLLAFNLDAIQALSPQEFERLARDHGEREHPAFMVRLTSEQFSALAEASRARSKTLDDLFRANRFLVIPDEALEFDSKAVSKVLDAKGVAHLEQLKTRLEECASWTASDLEAVVKAYAERHAEGRLGDVAQPLRVAVSGGTVSPPIFDTLAILGRASTLTRIARALDRVTSGASG
ncbi:MAG: glutamate--tRNA ligase [Phycisphaeraceae bacterium]|nr:glutamate--tRNA ligase [Phycisphaeraceae bacterium]